MNESTTPDPRWGYEIIHTISSLKEVADNFVSEQSSKANMLSWVLPLPSPHPLASTPALKLARGTFPGGSHSMNILCFGLHDCETLSTHRNALLRIIPSRKPDKLSMGGVPSRI